MSYPATVNFLTIGENTLTIVVRLSMVHSEKPAPLAGIGCQLFGNTFNLLFGDTLKIQRNMFWVGYAVFNNRESALLALIYCDA
jgi:hypothetical protein